MAALRISTPDLFRRLLPLAFPDLFDVEDCDDSGSREHVLDRGDDLVVSSSFEREVA